MDGGGRPIRRRARCAPGPRLVAGTQGIQGSLCRVRLRWWPVVFSYWNFGEKESMPVSPLWIGQCTSDVSTKGRCFVFQPVLNFDSDPSPCTTLKEISSIVFPSSQSFGCLRTGEEDERLMRVWNGPKHCLNYTCRPRLSHANLGETAPELVNRLAILALALRGILAPGSAVAPSRGWELACWKCRSFSSDGLLLFYYCFVLIIIIIEYLLPLLLLLLSFSQNIDLHLCYCRLRTIAIVVFLSFYSSNCKYFLLSLLFW